MKIHSFHIRAINVSPDRQRTEYSPDAIAELAGSISECGLIHPVVVRGSNTNPDLVAGGRRLKALEYLWNFGETLTCGGVAFAENQVPCIYHSDLSEVEAYEIELEENIRREDLSWVDRVQATARLADLKGRIAAAESLPNPSTSEIGKALYPDQNPSAAHTKVREDLIVSRHLSDPEVAKAANVKDAIKIIKRKEEAQRMAELGAAVGRTFSAKDHSIFWADSIIQIPKLTDHFDCILSDPPYGIGADTFNDSGNRTASTDGGHFYDDSYETWLALMSKFLPLTAEVAKEKAHLYLFCDIDRFGQLKEMARAAGWNPFRTPLIFVNPGAMRAPWPDRGPQRKYQCILYAERGGRQVTKLLGDVLTYPADENLGHPAQKPVALLSDLLKRSCAPGDSVLDPFCGSGSIFPAAHSLQIRATGIERDGTAYGIALKRLQGMGAF